MPLSNQNVLVTGADGFIGAHLVEHLVAGGANVTAFCLYNSFGSAGWLDELPPATREAIRIEHGDIRDPGFVARVVKGQSIVFHLAALIAIPYSYTAVQSYVDTNITGTVNVLEAVRAHNVGRMVHTSTSEVYGTAQFTPITESHPLQGQSPYSASKIGADHMVEAYARSFQTPAVILRPFNTYGPHQSERAVIPTIIRQMLDPQCTEIRLGDLSPRRDFNYVADTCEAFISAGVAPVCGVAGKKGSAGQGIEYGQAYNAGTGHAVSIGETVEALVAITGCNKPVIEDAKRRRPARSEVFELVASSDKLRAATGWAPQNSLVEGLSKTVDWWETQRGEGKFRVGRDYLV